MSVSQNQMARHYNNIAAKFSSTRQGGWMAEFGYYRDLVKDKMGATVLDIGCGNGRLFWLGLKDLNIDYTGVDISTKLLEFAKGWSDVENVAAKYKFLEGGFTALPVETHSCDYVVSVAAFHHLFSCGERVTALAEMWRVLKPGGTVVISVWNLRRFEFLKLWIAATFRSIWTLGKYSWTDFFFYWGDAKRLPSLSEVKAMNDPDLRYYHAFGKMELSSLLKNAGFEVVDIFGVSKTKLRVNRLKADNLVFVAKKVLVPMLNDDLVKVSSDAVQVGGATV